MTPQKDASKTSPQPSEKRDFSRLSSFPEENPNPVIELNLKLEVTYLNPAARKAFPDPAALESVIKGLEALAAVGQLRKEETSVREITCLKNTYYEQRVLWKKDYIRIYMTDLTERRRAGEALRESEDRFRQMAQNIREIFYLRGIRPDRVLYVSPAYEEVWGRGSDSLYRSPMSWAEAIHPDDRERVLRAVETMEQGSYSVEYRILRPDGSLRWIRDRNFPVLDGQGAVYRLAGVAEDITEQKAAGEALLKTEAQLRQAVKMEALGRLAGGVAHDFNNLMTAIFGCCGFLLDGLASGDPRRSDVEEIQAAAERGTALTRQLLAFTRNQVSEARVLDLNAVVSGMKNLLRRVIGEHIELAVVLGRDLGGVRADPGQIEQVILNLCVNARDAISQKGKLTIETSNSVLDESYCGRLFEAKPGPYVRLSITDTGSGMDQETQSHLFEPFFTTKERGKGTGLGLSTVYGIVKQSRGHVSVYSEPGLGTTFNIYLPLIGEPAEAVPEPKSEASPPKGSETILLAEDDESVRPLLRRMLERYGYRVLEAKNAQEALRLCREHKDPIHLLLTDVVMPGMRGPQLARGVKEMRPEIKVVFMSGYTDMDMIALDAAYAAAFLPKPILPEALGRKVREALDSKTHPVKIS